ncbi:MAG: protein kinase domain-containing protein [Planctomycetota bacterium]|jgi:serine/threonine-protein kinase
MAEDEPAAGEGSADADESRLDAGLEAGFGPHVAMADPQEGMSVLAELESRLGSETRVVLRDEVGAEQAPAGEGLITPSARGAARYERLGEIARGGMGVIIRSRDNDLGRDVAMKVLQSRHAGNKAMVRRFVEEAQIAGQLQHPGILQVYELGLQDDKRPYFTMKLIKGRTLAELLEARAAPDEDLSRFLGIFERVCQTVAYAHARGVIHRDLKPANVMVGSFGEVQIVDWGLAKLIPGAPKAAEGRPSAPAAQETEIHIPQDDRGGSQSIAGSVMGTPAYMPPEQARGDVRELDERSDVFALGAILCEIVTGSPPYVGVGTTTLEDAKDGHLDEAWARLDASGADDELVHLARSCMAPRRRERPRTAQVVADQLSAYLASVGERARAAELAAVEASARAAEERRARRFAVALAATMLAAVVIGGGGFIWMQNQRLERLDRVAAASQEANRRLNEAMRLMAEAKQTPVSDQKPWFALRAAGAQVAVLHGAAELDEATRNRASAFLDEFSQADRDRRMIERIEDLVIVGATHEDQESWMRMEGQLRQAFLDYGIDVGDMPPDEIAARIRESDLAPQLTDGLELWMATSAHLRSQGVGRYTVEELMSWVDVLNEADPDPYRTAVRAQVWTARPDVEVIRGLARSAEFETAPPRTLARLATCFLKVGDTEAVDDVFRRALHLHPADFMLNFDRAYQLATLERWEEAIRYYHRAVALRPRNGGIWRQLGVAFRETGDLEGSIDALSQSIEYQPDYAPTFVDLGLTRVARGDLDGGIEAYRTALRLGPKLAIAHCHLGRALQAKGLLVEALEQLKRGHELGSRNPAWDHPSQEWIDQCRRLLEARRIEAPAMPRSGGG